MSIGKQQLNMMKNCPKVKGTLKQRRERKKELSSTGNASWNNVPNKTLLVGTFLCAVLGTLRSRFCVPDTVLDVPDIIWNILPNNIRHIFLIFDL
jgi:hypothetical protein